MRIFLLGMPGSGKSTIGRYLSQQSNLQVIDLDKIIEQEEGQSITEIFKTTGEQKFRQLERDCLRKVIDENSSGIVSCGGGTPCYYNNMELMKSNGQTIYIDVPVETLITRTSKSTKRPLLQGDVSAKISELLREREFYYKQAEEIFETKGLDSSVVAKEIADQIFSS